MNISVLLVALLVIFSFFVLTLRATQYASFTDVNDVDISYIISTIKPITLPFGDTTVFPNFRYVALYGSAVYENLGALGEQPITQSIDKAKALANSYQPYSEKTVIPTFEIITTVASELPTDNNDYSQETEISRLRPWIDAAYNAGVYVLLDLQLGRSDFLTQAKEYQELLLEPHVGLALDPEWRLKKDEFHLQQIGSVSSEEVNLVSKWLADLVQSEELPQKIFLLHQFRTSMIENRENLDTSREELGYVIQMDGQGTTAGKNDTWKAITSNPPKNTFFGWKNFYDEDTPLRSPAETMKIRPMPYYISYQ